MTKGEARLYSLISFIGIGLGIASVVVATLRADEWIWKTLFSSSLLSVWTACLLFFKAAKEHHLEVDAVLKTHMGIEKERQLLEHSIRSLLFGGSDIDNIFCVKYGEVLLSEGDDSLMDHIGEVLQSKKTSKVRIERGRAYNLMQILLRRVSERHEKYWALATELDLDTPEAFQFLFKVPQAHPDNVVRVFVLRSDESLRKMISKAGSDLARQIELGAELRILIDPDDPTPNFGIYGSLAVGYFEDRETNVFDFRKTNVENKREIFDLYRSRAEDLRKHLPALPHNSCSTGRPAH
jgi:hypothetical protein